MDLPEELVDVCNCPNVWLHWLDKNTYVHKRHEIFRHIDDNVCVFSFDDDVQYHDNLIRGTMENHNKYPLSIINYERYSEHRYDGRKILYKNFSKYKQPSIRVRWCGQSMFPAYLYPKQILSPENIKIRDEICPLNDEPWITPWIVHNKIPVLNQCFGWGEDIDSNISHKEGLCTLTKQTLSSGYTLWEECLYKVLTTYPFLKKNYEALFDYDKQP